MIDKIKILIITIIVLIIDLLSKVIVSSNLSLYESISVIKGFFNITYHVNYGAAFSIFNNSNIFLILITLLIIIFLIYYIIKNNKFDNLYIISYGLLFGGALGNLFDRIKYSYVRDFLDFKIFNYDAPIFNVADMCITFGVIILLIKTRKGKG